MPQAILRTWASFLPWINPQHYDSARTVESMATPNLTQPFADLKLQFALFICESSVFAATAGALASVSRFVLRDWAHKVDNICLYNAFLTRTQHKLNGGVFYALHKRTQCFNLGCARTNQLQNPSCFWCWLACKCPQVVPGQLNTLKWKPCVMLQGLKSFVSMP